MPAIRTAGFQPANTEIKPHSAPCHCANIPVCGKADSSAPGLSAEASAKAEGRVPRFASN